MAQRNPMNQRYQGDGPGGQTRKSAARAKPVTEAASSVHIRKKPTTDAEKRAARKANEKEQERKAVERARRKADREKAAAEAAASAEAGGALAEGGAADGTAGAAGGDAASGGKAGRAGGRAGGGGRTGAVGSSGGKAGLSGTKGAAAKPSGQTEQPKGFLQRLLAPAPNMPASLEYKKWRRVYWILIGIGVVCVAISFVSQTYLASISPLAWMIVLGGAYATIIAAFIVDFRKVRPLVKEHQKQGTGNKTPKQLKHEQEAKERAEALEAARKAARDAKRSARRRKTGEYGAAGEGGAGSMDDGLAAATVPGADDVAATAPGEDKANK